MQKLSPILRANNLTALANQSYDVLVIGGGVTGAGVALDAAARGYKVALVDKGDFASSTSSKSTKLVHGGIRYLPNFDFALVHEGVVERGILLRNAPHLVHPLAFMLPIYEGDRHPVGMPFTTPGGIGLASILDIGLWMYDLMAGRLGIKHHTRISRQKVMQDAPQLVQKGLKEGFIYYDGRTNDARLTMTLLHSAIQRNAIVANHAEVRSLLIANGKICGAHVRDVLGGQEFDIHARHVVNATGVYAENIELMTGFQSRVEVEPSKGIHLVLSKDDITIGNSAVVLPETEDKRLLFILPWQSRIIFGTTDTGTGDLDHPVSTHEDIAYLLKYLNRYFTVNLTEDNIISTYAGYRPLVRPRNRSGKSTAKISRTHEILQGQNGLVTIVGGKITSYRRMAQDTVDVLSRRDRVPVKHPTKQLLLQGSVDWPESQLMIEKRGSDLGLPASSIQHLLDNYGTDADLLLDLTANDRSLARLIIQDLPYIYAEIVYACRYEMAVTLHDVLAQRTAIILEDRRRGLDAAADVAALMAREHRWSDEQQQAMIDAYRTAILKQLTAEKSAESITVRSS